MGYYDDFSVKTFTEELKQNSISLVFNGSISQDAVEMIGVKLIGNDQAKLLSKRIFSLVIEMAQNIHHYSANKIYSEQYDREIGIGVLAVGETLNHYIISSGNYIKPGDCSDIIQQIDALQGMSEEGLKDLYRQRRKMPQNPDKPGANLGFIHMRRKSGNPVDYQIKESPNTNPFFILSTKVNKQ
ncbi:MAG: SiaB family protein kinase [Bacteroidota bacterium]